MFYVLLFVLGELTQMFPFSLETSSPKRAVRIPKTGSPRAEDSEAALAGLTAAAKSARLQTSDVRDEGRDGRRPSARPWFWRAPWFFEPSSGHNPAASDCPGSR